MNPKQFTTSAAVLWSVIPIAAREHILKNVFCGQCRGAVEIVKFTGHEENGDIVMEGQCANCGHAVVRVIESSEIDPANN